MIAMKGGNSERKVVDTTKNSRDLVSIDRIRSVVCVVFIVFRVTVTAGSESDGIIHCRHR
jgi:hypothetical protein